VLLFDQTIRAEGRDLDRYGRLVARIRVSGKDSSLELLRAGLACHYTDYSSDPVLAKAEADARAAARGFWAASAPKPRCALAVGGAGPGASSPAAAPVQRGGFHGNTVSRVYHAPHCRNFNCPNCTRIFATEDEARKAGFRPAGDCFRQR
jgi:hypothetical protein